MFDEANGGRRPYEKTAGQGDKLRYNPLARPPGRQGVAGEPYLEKQLNVDLSPAGASRTSGFRRDSDLCRVALTRPFQSYDNGERDVAIYPWCHLGRP